jgi:molybdopterin/thiamine biosynthesis adenylyltransferase
MQVTLVGLGNIGSFAAGLVARLPEVRRLTVIDRDRFQPDNSPSQLAERGDSKKAKAHVLAARLRRSRPDLAVDGVFAAVEDLPTGRLSCNVLLAAVDTLATRQYLNEVSWLLGIPWIDGGVQADGGLVRISVYQPSPDAPCLECSWDQRHYDALEAEYACGGQEAPRTNAPACLGAVAAGLLAIECRKFLTDGREQAAIGKQIVLDTAWHKHYLVQLQRNPRCRFHHLLPAVERLNTAPQQTTMNDLFSLAGSRDAVIRMPGRERFAKTTACQACGRVDRSWRLIRETRPPGRMCRRCGGRSEVTGFDMTDQLCKAELPETLLTRPLSRFGFTSGDILTVGERYIQLGGGDA